MLRSHLQMGARRGNLWLAGGGSADHVGTGRLAVCRVSKTPRDSVAGVVPLCLRLTSDTLRIGPVSCTAALCGYKSGRKQ